LGSAAVADVSAARLLMMPVLLAKIGWGKIVVPHGSKLRESNQKPRFFKEQAFACLIFIVCIGAYILVLLSFSGILNRFLFTEHYADSFQYLMYWGVFFIVAFFALSASYGLQAMKEFYILTKVNIYTMLVTVAGTYFFIQWFGIKGGFAALILGGALAAIAFWYFFVQIVFPKLGGREPAPLKKVFIHKPN
jgi:O-antigen/teichoic acid export membrane protein